MVLTLQLGFPSFLPTSNTLAFPHPSCLRTASTCFLLSSTSRRLPAHGLCFTRRRSFAWFLLFWPSTANFNILPNTTDAHCISLNQPETSLWSRDLFLVRETPEGDFRGHLGKIFSSTKNKSDARRSPLSPFPSSILFSTGTAAGTEQTLSKRPVEEASEGCRCPSTLTTCGAEVRPWEAESRVGKKVV